MKKKLFFTAVILAGLSMPKMSFGQAPTLGTTSSFALFTAVGAFSNDGATMVTGDIGTNVGAFTGFPPGTVMGQIQVTNPASVVAAIDVDVAYGSMSTITCGIVLSTTMGGGQVLTPDVYCLGAASTLNGDLVLDGQGDPNALFIFKIDGALATSTHANVVLINSARACNVYWQINGEFSVNDSATFRGTALVNGAIHLLEGSSLYGRALSRQGAIDLHNAYVELTDCAPCGINFFVKHEICPNDGIGKLTANVIGVGPFTYLWSNGSTDKKTAYTGGGTFTVTVTDAGLNGCGAMTITKKIKRLNKLIFVQDKIVPSCSTCCDGEITNAHAAGGTPPYTYLWSDGNTNANRTGLCAIVYTITITDANGCTLTIKKNMGRNIQPPRTATQMQTEVSVQLAPNPASDIINLSIETNAAADANVLIADITGRIVYKQSISVSAGSSSMPVDVSALTAGIYFMQMQSEGALTNIKFVKN